MCDFSTSALNHANVSWSLSVLKCINKATVKEKNLELRDI